MTGLALAAEACGIETLPSNFAMVMTVLALTGKYMLKMFSYPLKVSPASYPSLSVGMTGLALTT